MDGQDGPTDQETVHNLSAELVKPIRKENKYINKQQRQQIAACLGQLVTLYKLLKKANQVHAEQRVKQLQASDDQLTHLLAEMKKLAKEAAEGIEDSCVIVPGGDDDEDELDVDKI